jgi:tRNA threonylcarbamoyladenosine biosynthesis protein TsaB
LNILTIDTSTNTEIIAAAKQDQYANLSSQIEISHSQTIFKNIDTALKELKLSINDIKLIGVGIGPGSFTGIRIAVTTARMLAQVLNIPLVGVSTPLIFATALNASYDDYVLIAFDAKKKKVFGALYKITQDKYKPQEIVKPGDYYIDDLIKELNNSATVHCYGNGINRYFEDINGKLNKMKNYENFIPEAEAVSNLTKSLYEAAPEAYLDYKLVTPDYTRKSDAEVAKDSKNSK